MRCRHSCRSAAGGATGDSCGLARFARTKSKERPAFISSSYSGIRRQRHSVNAGASGSLMSDLALLRGALEPVPVMRRAKPGIISRNKALIVHFYAEVTRVVIGDHLARIASRTKELPDKFVLPELIGPGHFDRAIDRLSKSH